MALSGAEGRHFSPFLVGTNPSGEGRRTERASIARRLVGRQAEALRSPRAADMRALPTRRLFSDVPVHPPKAKRRRRACKIGLSMSGLGLTRMTHLTKMTDGRGEVARRRRLVRGFSGRRAWFWRPNHREGGRRSRSRPPNHSGPARVPRPSWFEPGGSRLSTSRRLTNHAREGGRGGCSWFEPWRGRLGTAFRMVWRPGPASATVDGPKRPRLG